MCTLPTTAKGTAKVHAGRGVKINYLSYWADAFRDPEVESAQVPVRYDPFDAGHAYAFVRGRWVECISEYYPHFRGRSQREIMAATAELHRRRRAQARDAVAAPTARALADFLDTLKEREDVLAQRLREAEGRRLGDPATGQPTGMGMGDSQPPGVAPVALGRQDAPAARTGARAGDVAASPSDVLEPFEEYV